MSMPFMKLWGQNGSGKQSFGSSANFSVAHIYYSKPVNSWPAKTMVF